MCQKIATFNLPQACQISSILLNLQVYLNSSAHLSSHGEVTCTEGEGANYKNCLIANLVGTYLQAGLDDVQRVGEEGRRAAAQQGCQGLHPHHLRALMFRGILGIEAPPPVQLVPQRSLVAAIS